MNNTNAKLKLTFDSLDAGENPSKQANEDADANKAYYPCSPTLLQTGNKHRLWSVEHSVGTCWKFIRKAIKFYEVFGGLNKYINSRDFSVLS